MANPTANPDGPEPVTDLEILESYCWPTDDFGLASLGLRLAEVAARSSLPTQRWMEDGLGEAEGVCCRTRSGLVFLLRELRHAVTHLGSKGPDVYVDAEVLGRLGVEQVIGEIRQVLNLSQCDVVWMQPSSVQVEAAERGRWAREYKEQRNSKASKNEP